MSNLKNKLRKMIREEIQKINLNEDRFTRAAHTDEQERSIKMVVKWLRKMGITPSKALSVPEVPLRWEPEILIDINYQGSEIRVGWEGEITAGYQENIRNEIEFANSLYDYYLDQGIDSMVSKLEPYI